MITDTTFLWDYLNEQRNGKSGAASKLIFSYRRQNLRVPVIAAGEISVVFHSTASARDWLQNWKILFLHMGIVDTAAEIDREQIRKGKRLSENDNWIAGFARYYREPLISRDKGFDGIAGIRRVTY
jgi:predicted nucleic acid-binding protein